MVRSPWIERRSRLLLLMLRTPARRGSFTREYERYFNETYRSRDTVFDTLREVS